MTKEEYKVFHRKSIEKMARITEAKNADYTGVTDDPFANFRQSESFRICSAEHSIVVRVIDKISRISSFLQTGSFAVSDESFDDTCLDAANYLILLAGLRKSRAISEKK